MPGMTIERIMESYARQGKHIERIMPAHEVDIQAWQEDCTNAWGEMDGYRHRVARAPTSATSPWVEFLRRKKNSNPKTQEQQP